MTKVFDHAVIWNGEFVPANTPIEVKEEETPAETEAEETPAETEAEKKPAKKAAKSDDNA